METDKDVIDMFKALVKNTPGEVDEWIVHLNKEYELHLVEINKLKTEIRRLEQSHSDPDRIEDLADQLMNIYDTKSESIYQEFRKRFNLDNLEPATQAKLDEIHYELTKLKK